MRMNCPLHGSILVLCGLLLAGILTSPCGAQETRPGSQPVMTSAPASMPYPVELRAEEFLLQNPDAVVRLTQEGAGILAVDLTAYKDRLVEAPKPPLPNIYPVLNSIGGERGLVSLAAESVTIEDLKVTARLGRFSQVSPVAELPDGSRSISFSERVTIAGKPILQLVRRYTLLSHKALGLDDKEIKKLQGAVTILVEQDIVNLDSKAHRVSFSFFGPTGLRAEDARGDFLQVFAAQRLPDKNVVLYPHLRNTAIAYHWPFSPGTSASLADDTGTNKLAYIANINKYFAAVLAPLGANTTFRTDAIKRGADNDPDQVGDISSRWVTTAVEVQAGKTETLKWELFLTPRTESALITMGAHRASHYLLLKDANMPWCTFGWLTWLMVAIMDLGHLISRDYGIAIILLVILVRVVLHPLTKYGQIHMLRFSQAMKVMGPKLKVIQEKYKDDKAAQGQAMQALYAEAKVSPAGPLLGCLPMFVQMPIWVALYYGISNSIELRHQPFWPVYYFTQWLLPNFLADLSAPDRLIWWGGNLQIPLLGTLFQMGPIQSLNILPFGMGFFMYLNQKLMPQASAPGGNPEQERINKMMMNFMPWFFAFIMYNMPSGLNLYIMTSMAMGVVEQKRIRRHFYELHPEADPANAPAPGALAADGGTVTGTLIEKEDYTESWRARKRKK